jgi:apolipoprotein N-acyltransferase
VPLRSLVEKIANLNSVPRDVIVGHNNGALSTPAGRLAILNSYEAFFTGRGRNSVRAGAEILVVETNTSSYATSQAPAMELAASRLQAIAEGRTLVQAATTGYSAVISPDGSIEISSRLGRPSLISARVALRSGETLYDRLGDAWVVVVALVALSLAWSVEVVGRRKARYRSGELGGADRLA